MKNMHQLNFYKNNVYDEISNISIRSLYSQNNDITYLKLLHDSYVSAKLVRILKMCLRYEQESISKPIDILSHDRLLGRGMIDIRQLINYWVSILMMLLVVILPFDYLIVMIRRIRVMNFFS